MNYNDLTQNRFTEFKGAYDLYGTHEVMDDYHNIQKVRDDDPKATLYIMVTPISDQVYIEEYGERISEYRQFVYYGTDTLHELDQVEFGGEMWEITRILQYQTHAVVHMRRL